MPQLTAAIEELQAQVTLAGIPEAPSSDEKSVRARYDAIKGSAVNPVLREGTGSSRCPCGQNYAMKNPHSMGEWTSSQTHVASMPGDDFRSNEVSATITAAQAGKAKIEFMDETGNIQIPKDGLDLLPGTGRCDLYASLCSARFSHSRNYQGKEGVLFSLHLKATMMKVSDPIIFGHAVSVFFENIFSKHKSIFAELGVNPNSGLGDVLGRRYIIQRFWPNLMRLQRTLHFIWWIATRASPTCMYPLMLSLTPQCRP